MKTEESKFEEVIQYLKGEGLTVEEGKMMSSRGIKSNNKVFAFYYQESMTFRLGRDFDPESEGIHHYEFLNPFKNKPAMKDWFIISHDYADKWNLLAEIALAKLNTKFK